MSVAVGGVSSLTVDGVPLNVKGNVSIQDGADQHEVVVGLDRVHGHMVKPRAASVKATLTVPGDLDVKALQLKTNATVVVTMRSGKIFALRSAVTTGDFELNVENAELSCEFQGEGEWINTGVAV